MKHTTILTVCIGIALTILALGCAPLPVTREAPPPPVAQSTEPKASRPAFGAAPAALVGDEVTVLLDTHNNWRARYGSPPLTWDDSIAAFAQEWADQLANTDTFEHRQNNQFGENLWTGTSGAFPIQSVVDDWGNEVKDFDLATNTCAAGAVCGHFTQVVWAKTARLGCAKATSGSGNDIVVCNYDPAGNMMGESPFVAGTQPLGAAPGEPTAEATQEAPAEPTAEATQEAPAEPTAAPTEVPTVAATEAAPAEPTTAPTEVPTVAATEAAPAVPTVEPTVEPTAVPTVEPTAVPTVEPTVVPTVVPTAVPTVVPPTQPPQNPAVLTEAEKQLLLTKHNEWRARFNMPPMVWDTNVEAVAQDWANHLAATGEFAHRQNNRFGENLWATSANVFSVASAVDSWGNEVSNYNLNTNTCAPGKVCGHFTQVVWKSSTKLGCAKSIGPVWRNIVCNYDPPGNFTGQNPFNN